MRNDDEIEAESRDRSTPALTAPSRPRPGAYSASAPRPIDQSATPPSSQTTKVGSDPPAASTCAKRAAGSARRGHRRRGSRQGAPLPGRRTSGERAAPASPQHTGGLHHAIWAVSDRRRPSQGSVEDGVRSVGWPRAYPLSALRARGAPMSVAVLGARVRGARLSPRCWRRGRRRCSGRGLRRWPTASPATDERGLPRIVQSPRVPRRRRFACRGVARGGRRRLGDPEPRCSPGARRGGAVRPPARNRAQPHQRTPRSTPIRAA